MKKLFAWADEFDIPQDIFPRDKEKLLSLEELKLKTYQITYYPPEIVKLQNLKTINFYSSSFELNKLKKLERFELEESSGCETPPYSELSKLRHLKELILRGSGIDEDYLEKLLPHLLNLRVLDISNNRVNETNVLCDSIVSLYKLEELHLSDTRISYLPFDFGVNGLKRLKKLSMCSCNVTEIDWQISTLTRLEHLMLYENYIEEIPEELGELKFLRSLDLEHNYIRDLPESIKLREESGELSVNIDNQKWEFDEDDEDEWDEDDEDEWDDD